MGMPHHECDLRWDTYLVVFTHAVLTLILFGVVFFLAVPPGQLIGEMSDSFPLSARLLMKTGTLWNHPIYVFVSAIGSLMLDAWVYSSLCRSKGKRAGTVWAASVTTILALAIGWYAVLGRLFLIDLVRLRIR